MTCVLQVKSGDQLDKCVQNVGHGLVGFVDAPLVCFGDQLLTMVKKTKRKITHEHLGLLVPA